MKIANRDARPLVQQLHPFRGNNLFAQFHTQNNADGTNGPDMWYVVYSYGHHWPLFVHANGVWFENADRHSVTTSKHHSQCHPHMTMVPLPLDWMKRLASGGFTAIAKERILQGEPA
jgi:hypothetical protein